MTRLEVKHQELTYEGTFARPAFSLLDTPGRVCESLFEQLEEFGLTAEDLAFEGGDPAERSIRCDLSDPDASVTVRGDQCEVHFSKFHSRDADRASETIGAVWQGLASLVDTGADHCLFERECADLLGIDVESGQPQAFRTAAGGFRAFAHPVSISVLGVQFESVVYFFADPGIKKNVLGRKGWLDRFRVGLVHYKSTLFLSHHGD